MTDLLGRDALTTIIPPERSGNPAHRRDSDRASGKPITVPEADLSSDEIVIVDDDPEVRDLLSGMFVEAGYQVTTFSDGNSFIAAARADTSLCHPRCLHALEVGNRHPQSTRCVQLSGANSHDFRRW